MSYDFADSDQEAMARYVRWKERDPYPDISPALLNSAEIIDYVVATGMVHPFRTCRKDEMKLKPASYEIDLLGEFSYWDEKGERVEGCIEPGAKFVLRHNSIAFVAVEPVFRLPDYIAARFNLRIKHVYRGILLGTGPLVDPGFQGPLFIPLHNLTSEDYVLIGGEGLIWMEFTKLTWTAVADKSPEAIDVPPRSGKSVPLEVRKTFKDLNYYLEHANSGKPIRSSIPIEITSATEAAARAQSEVRKLTFRYSIAGLVGGVGLLIAAIAASYGAYQLWFQAAQFVNDARKELHDVAARADAGDRKLDPFGRSLGASTAETARASGGVAQETNTVPSPTEVITTAPSPALPIGK